MPTATALVQAPSSGKGSELITVAVGINRDRFNVITLDPIDTTYDLMGYGFVIGNVPGVGAGCVRTFPLTAQTPTLQFVDLSQFVTPVFNVAVMLPRWAVDRRVRVFWPA